MKKTLSLTLMTLLLCVCMVFGLTACGGFTQDDIDNAVNSATADLNAEISELEADIAEKEAKITTLEGEKAALTTEKGELEADITALEAEKADLEADKAELEDEVETLEAEKKALADENAELEASITAKNTEIATLNSSVTALEDERTNLNGRVSELNAQITTLNEIIAELEASGEADKTEIAELKTKVSVLESEKETLTARVTALEGDIEDKNDKITALEADVATLTSEKADLEEQITTLNGTITTKNNEIATLNSSISALEKENATLKDDIGYLEETISARDTKIAALEADVATLTAEKQTLTDRVAALEAENEALESEKSELEKENENLKNCAKGNHSGTLSYTANADGTTHTKKYKCCEAVVNATEAHTVTEWTYDDTTHEGSCDHCGTTVTGDHSGSEATCIAKAECETCGASHGELAPNNHASTTYTNGFRDCCGEYQPAVLTTGKYDVVSNGYNEDGVYEIGNAGQLYWFAMSRNFEANAILTADITINENVLNADGTLNGDGSNFRTWTTIAGDGNAYFGFFDGNGKTISGLYVNVNGIDAGLFGYIDQGAVKNLGIVDSYVRGDVDAGGVAAWNDATVINCYYVGTVSVSGNGKVGGVVGYNRYGTVENCYTTDTVSGVVGVNDGTVTNSYYLGTSETDDIDGTTFKTTAQFASGEVAYLLNGDQSTTVFKQTLGTDDYPNFTGAKVYYGYNSCTETATAIYTNDSTVSAEKPAHSGGTATCLGYQCVVCGAWYGGKGSHASTTYTNGFRDCCGEYQPATDSDGDGYYEIGNAGQLYWFSAKVSESFNAILISDITVNENVLNADGSLNGDGSNFRVWVPIGNGTYMYDGNFDGNGKTISGLYLNDSSNNYVGLFGLIGGTVKNVGIVDSYLSGGGSVGGVVADNRGTVINCYNTGTISGNNNVGGVVGYNGSGGTVESSYSTGTVSGNSNVGGVVGYNSSFGGTVTNCYYLGTSETDDIDGTTFKTAEQFASADMATLLNGTQTDAPWEYIEGNVAPTLKVFKEDET